MDGALSCNFKEQLIFAIGMLNYFFKKSWLISENEFPGTILHSRWFFLLDKLV